MPNHITNILHIEIGDPGDVWQRIAGSSEGRALIDFNRVVQMPEIMEAESSIPRIEDMAKLFLGVFPVRELLTPPQGNPAESFKAGNYGAATAFLQHGNLLRILLDSKLAGDLNDEDFETLLKYMRAYRQFGHCNWYDWSVQYWGTKWNAYQQKRVDGRTIQFDTAWATPMPIWEKLSQMFPEHTFHVRWADEDFGSNTGDMRLTEGVVVTGGPLANSSPEAYRNAVDILHGGELPEEYRWKEDGTAEYIED